MCFMGGFELSVSGAHHLESMGPGFFPASAMIPFLSIAFLFSAEQGRAKIARQSRCLRLLREDHRWSAFPFQKKYLNLPQLFGTKSQVIFCVSSQHFLQPAGWLAGPLDPPPSEVKSS